jgi:hypothetical protein
MEIVMNYDFEQVADAFAWLDTFREFGEVNMFGAARYLAEELGHDKATSQELLQMWMKSFDSEVSADDRARSFGETV